MSPFKQKTAIQIRFKDIDKLGHVNHANHITYFELARMDYFEVFAGNDIKIDWENEGVILAKVEMEYIQPILLDEKVFAYTWVSRLGSKSFDMACSIVRTQNNIETEVAKGSATLVCFNYKTKESINVPEKWKVKMMVE
jgi:acyl-CoA thioester hydrolase